MDAGNMSSNMTMQRAFDYHSLGTHPHTPAAPFPTTPTFVTGELTHQWQWWLSGTQQASLRYASECRILSQSL